MMESFYRQKLGETRKFLAKEKEGKILSGRITFLWGREGRGLIRHHLTDDPRLIGLKFHFLELLELYS